VRDADATVSRLTRQPAHTALFFDFDGSLAPIVEHPDDARPLPAVPGLLRRLVPRVGRVGVVSGRPVAFLVRHLPVEGLAIAGLYGMESVVDGARVVDARVRPYLGAVAAAAAELRDRFPADVVEDKEGVAVTLHWRPAPELAGEVRAAADEVARRYGLAQLPTRMAVELRPPVAIDKGVTVDGLASGFAVGAFAGDDTGDLPAFAALRAAVARGSLSDAVCIGVHSAEAPADLLDQADVVVDGPAGLVALLARVADEIPEPVGGGPGGGETPEV